MKTPRRISALATPLVLALACVTLAACGSSSTSSNASASASSSTSAPAGGSAGGGTATGRFAALRACLAKEGVTLPQRPAGTRPPGSGGGGFGGFGGGGGGGFGAGGGAAANPKLRAALQKCGGGFGAGGGFRRRLSSPTVVAALNKFVACMNTNGITLPAPNTSGTGPVFNTKGIDTTSTAFKTAYAKCATDLRGSFGRGATGAAGAGGAGGTGTA